MMDNMIKESVATLFCHAIKLDDKDISVKEPIFCRFMGQNFDCKSEDAKNLLNEVMQKDEGNIDTHIAIVSNALHNEPYKKMNILKQLNHIIFKSKMRDEDYEYFDKVKNSFFTR
jgi:ABC-type enterochelin transport system ATPase subunit